MVFLNGRRLFFLVVIGIFLFSTLFSVLNQTSSFHTSGTLITGAAVAGQGSLTKPAEDIRITDAVTQCGTLTTNAEIANDLNGTNDCLVVGANHLIIDGQGFSIIGNQTGFGIYLNNKDNVTIKNFGLISNFSVGIYMQDCENCTIFNNTIAGSLKSNGYGIQLSSDSYANISNNVINTTGSSSDGINIGNGNHNNTLIFNNITTFNSSSSGVGLMGTSSDDHKVRFNRIFTKGGSRGIYLRGARNFIEGNVINSTGNGITMDSSNRGDNIILNNNITYLGGSEITDTSGNTYINYLIYNNSDGEIRWMNTADGGILKDMEVNSNNNQGIGLGRNIFIGANATAVNLSAFGTGVNSSVNITLKSLSFDEVNIILRAGGYYTDSGSIASAGTDCLDISCFNISYDTGTLLFNSSWPGSFTVQYDGDAPVISSAAVDKVVDVINHSFRLNASVIDSGGVSVVFFTIQSLGNITATANGNEYYVICDKINQCNTTQLVNYTWIMIWANDTFGFMASSSVNLLFNVTPDTESPTIDSPRINSSSINLLKIVRLNVSIADNGNVSEVRFNIEPFGNLTASGYGPEYTEYYVVCNATSVCNTSSAGSFNWTSIWVNDSSNNINTSAVALQFNVSVQCSLAPLTSYTLTNDFTNCSGHGIEVSVNNTILDCAGHWINGTSLNGSYGVYVTADNVTVKNCRIHYFERGISAGEVDESGNAVETVILSTFVNNTIIGPVRNGIFLVGSSSVASRNYVANNTILNSNSTALTSSLSFFSPEAGIYSHYSRYNSYIGNNVSHSQAGFFLQCPGLFQDNYLWNNTYGYGVGHVSNTWQNVSQCNITGGRIIGNANGLFYNFSPTTNITVRDVYFDNNSFDLYDADPGFNRYLYIINSSINKSKIYVGTSFLRSYVKWYVDVNVTNTTGAALSNATVTAYNSIDAVEDIENTSTNGLGRLEVTEFYSTNNAVYYLTPGDIIVHKQNYSRNSSTADLLNKTSASVNISIRRITCGGLLHADTDLMEQQCGAAGYSIGSDEIIIYGGNTNLNGSGTDKGINISAKESVVVQDLTISLFERAVDLEQSNHSRLSNVRLVNNTYGVMFNRSHNNTAYDSIIGNNSFDVYATNDGGTNNSLINVSMDVNNITVVGSASVYKGWYVLVNITINEENTPLGQANVTAYRNDWVLDGEGKTDNSGTVRMELNELKVNSSGISYFSNTSINISFTLAGTTYRNSTTINLTQTNNTVVNLHLILDCTTPANNLALHNDTTFCPGTYAVGRMTAGSPNIILSCETSRTVFDSGGIWLPDGTISEGFDFNSSNVTLKYCSFLNYYQPLDIQDSDNATIFNNSIVTAYNSGIKCYNSDDSNFSNNYISGVSGGSSTNVGGIVLYNCNRTAIVNNTFYGNGNDVVVDRWSRPVTDLLLYWNSFSGTYYFAFGDAHPSILAGVNVTGNYNITVNGSAQGNKYADYCDQGIDNDGDGYADNSTTNTSGDWPYNKTVSSAIYSPNANPTDYGPVVYECITQVTLSSSSGGSGGSSGAAAAGAGAAAAAAPAAPSAPSQGKVQKIGNGYNSAEELLKNMKIDSGLEGEKDTKKLYFSLTNTGDKTAYFESEVKAEKEESFTVYQSKSVEHTAQLLGTGWLPTGNLGKERLTTISLPTDLESFSVSPGETKNIELDIGALSATKRTISFVLKEANSQQDVLEKETVVEPVWGNAVDHISEENLVDIYIVKPEEDAGQEKAYTFEISVIRKESSETPFAGMKSLLGRFLTSPPWEKRVLYSETYGPRTIGREGFIFTQQYKYDCQLYNGKNIILVKTIDEKGNTIVDNEFPLEMSC